LAYAHSRKDRFDQPLNIIHCDICPHNILINREGVPKLTDFGIARAATIQSSDHVSGKLAFMSPEQYNDPQSVTFASDIYSLGVVLFYMLCNHYTRDVRSGRQGVIQQIRCNYINWDALPDDLPDNLRAILKKMLEFDPACRYRDCHELVQVLEYYIYRDGYGPTMVTLSKYMHEFMPGYFGKNSGKKNNAPLPAPESLERYQVSTEL
jgi:serine/threonine protein kinase